MVVRVCNKSMYEKLRYNTRRKLVDLTVSIRLFFMSRRSQSRKSARGGKKSSRAGKWVLRISLILLVGVILTGFGVYSWLRSYMHSDDFRIFVSDTVGSALSADAHFELFEWQGMDARTDGFVSENGQNVRAIKADGVQAKIGLGGISRGVWEVSDVRINQLNLLINTFPNEKGDDNKADEDNAKAILSSNEPGLLSGWLPDRVEFDSIEVASADINLKTSAGGLRARDLAVRIDSSSAGAFDILVTGGLIDTNWFGSQLDLISARGKWRNGRIFLTDSRAKVYKRGRLSLNGELEGDEFGLYGSLSDVRAEELVPPNWQKSIMGNLNAKFKVLSGNKNTVLRGKVKLTDGVLTALPILDTIAAYSNTRRFRNLVLSEATFKFWKEGQRLDIKDIVIASEGLVRVVGNITVDKETLNGRFRVGIVPGTLSHIPGAETKVFLRGDKGLLWAPLRITGTLDNPKEDLTDRMIAAAGERMFELVPETGKMALKFAHESAVELPSKAVDAVGKILEGDPEGAVGEGVDIIRKGAGSVLDLIPGVAPRKKHEAEGDE